MKHLPLLAVVLVLVLALLGALSLGWLDLGLAPGSDSVENGAGTTEPSTTRAADPSAHELDSATSETEPRERASVAVAGETPVAASTLRGHVAAPEGTPTDPTLEVFVLRVPHGNAALAHALDRRDVDEHMGAAERREREQVLAHLIARAPVGPGGDFEVPLPADARTVFLQVRGRYLFLREATPARLAAGEARVTPELGGWITGRLTAEGAAPLADVPVVVFPRSGDSASPMGGFGMPSDVFSIVDLSGAGGRFEFLAVPATAGYTVAVLPPAASGVAASRDTSVDFEPGEHVELEVALSGGGRVRGRVVDGAGRGVEGADVEAALAGRFFGFDDLPARKGESGPDGSFELAGVPFGRVKVHADHRRYLESSKTVVEVPEVGAAEGIRLVLSEGKTIAGRLTYTDGSAAPDVRVEASFDQAFIAGMTFFNSLRGARARTDTDAEGAFVLQGLGGGPFVVQARVEGEEPELSLSARLDGVKPGTKGVALVLRQPLGVHGRVVDTAGEPLESFTVVAERKVAGEFLTLTDAVRRGDFQSADGAFLLAGLSEGRWEVGAEGDGWLNVGVSELTLPAQTEREPLVIVVERTVTVRGRVLSPSGEPLSGARVEPDSGAPGWMAAAVSDTRAPHAVSGNAGAFELSGVPAGKSAVYATARGFARSASVSVEAAPGDVVEEIELRLTAGGTLTGEVLDDDGEPASGRMVAMNHIVNMSSRVTVTDAGGRFESRNMQPGHWQLVAMNATADWSGTDSADMGAMMAGMDLSQAEIVEGETTHVVIGEPPANPVRVSGEVTHDGRPWSGALVSFYPEGSRLYERLAFSSVKDDGSYAMELPQPGHYVVSIQKIAGGGAQQNTLEFAENVPAVAEHRIDFEIPLGRISGRVLAPGGAGAAGARVTLTPDEAQRTDSFFGGQYTEITAAQDGSYDVEGLRPGRYRLSAGGAPIYNPGAAARFGRVTRGGLLVGEDEWLQGVDLSLPAPGTLDVTVLDGGGAPVPQATVFVRDSEGRVLEPFAVLVTDGAGRCEYPGVAPGEYTVSARTAGHASHDSPPVKLAEGGRAAVKLTLEQGTILWIKVKDGEGEELRAALTIEDDDGRDVGDMFGMQDLQVLYLEGAFSPTEHRLGPLPPGRYKVHAEAGGDQATKSVRLRGEPEKTMTIRIR